MMLLKSSEMLGEIFLQFNQIINKKYHPDYS